MVRTDRGQLLLIGAVLIGLTIIGTVVMLNGMQYADATSTQSEHRMLDDAERTEEMIERDIGRLTTQILAYDPTNAEARTYLEANITAYDNQSRNMTLSRGGPTVNATYNDTATRGTRFREPTGPDFEPSAASGSWTMAEGVNHTHRFQLDVDTFDNPGIGNGLLIIFDIDGGDEWEFRVFEQSGNFVVQTRAPMEPSWDDHCDYSGPPPELDLVRGEAYYPGPDTTCSFPSVTTEASTPYSISLDRSYDVDGEFDVLVDGDETSESSAIATDYPVVPAVDFTYSSTEFTYNRTVWAEGGPS